MTTISKPDIRRSQQAAAILAIIILSSLLLMFPVGGGFADYLNSIQAPEDETLRFKEANSWSTIDFDMDATAFKSNSGFKSYYVWYNTTGYKNYNNVTHTSGVISVNPTSTAGNTIASNISWSQGDPYFEIVFDYTAKQMYDDNICKILLKLDSLYVSSHPKARTVTLTAGDVTLYSTTIAKTDTEGDLEQNITLDANKLREAIINKGIKSYLTLKITGQDTTLTIAGSKTYTYNVTKLTGRDEALFFIGAITVAITFAGVFLVQPGYSLSFGRKNGKGGGY